MQWGTLKKAVRDLGFEEDEILTEYSTIFINSVNRAIKEINRSVRPVTSFKEVVLPGDTSGFRRINLGSESDFMGIYGTPVIETDSTGLKCDVTKTCAELDAISDASVGDMYRLSDSGTAKGITFIAGEIAVYDGVWKKHEFDTISDFSDYRIETDSTVVVKNSISGKIRFFYRKLPTAVTENTADTAVLDVLKEVDVLLPLLTAYYVWLDDDESKANAYYEKYTIAKNEILLDYQNREIEIKATCYGGLPW